MTAGLVLFGTWLRLSPALNNQKRPNITPRGRERYQLTAGVHGIIFRVHLHLFSESVSEVATHRGCHKQSPFDLCMPRMYKRIVWCMPSTLAASIGNWLLFLVNHCHAHAINFLTAVRANIDTNRQFQVHSSSSD